MSFSKFLSSIPQNDQYNFVSKNYQQLYVKQQNDLLLLDCGRTHSFDQNLPFLSDCRGLIIDTTNNTVVCRPMEQISNSDLPTDETPTSITECIEGTIMNLFYNDNAWRYSTNRCIDASKSRWCSVLSHQDLFMEASSNPDNMLQYTNLDKNSTYTFILCHPDNKIVVAYEKPTIYHISTRDNATGRHINDDIGIQRPKSFDSSSDHDFVDQIGYIYTYGDDSDAVRRYKSLSPDYQSLLEMRADNPRVTYRYIEVRQNEGMDAAERFLSNFPECKQLEGAIRTIVSNVHRCYINRYVNKMEYELTEDYDKILGELHYNYRHNDFQKTTYQTVLDHLNGYPAGRMISLLRRLSVL